MSNRENSIMSGPDARVPDAAIIGPSGEAGPDALRGVDRLLAIEEIRLTKARYCAAVDDHDWKALRSVFTDDCVIDWPLPGHKVETLDEFVSFLAGAMTQSIQARHHVHNLQIEFTSGTEAIVRWDHENWTWFDDGSRPNIQQWGQYREKYRQTARGWRIAYFSEQNLFNSAAPAKRRRAGIGDGDV
jgi:ketosteroid isomerase-like protein